jgi:hypothetical protein
MADVNKIPGAAPNDPARGPREPVKPGSGRFQELMKVGNAGDQQKKKKKRREESEEQSKAELRSGTAEPDKSVEGSKKAEKYPKIQKVGESEKKQPQQQKRPEETAAIDEVAAANVNRQKLENINLDEVPSPALEKTEKPAIYTGKIIQQQEVEKEVFALGEKEDEVKLTVRKQEKKESADIQASQTLIPASTTLGPSFIAPASSTAPGYTHLNTEMLALFEKMVSLIMVMQAKGDNETTIFLDTPEYASSFFSGAQITIKEFSTAPYVYNIEFLGNAQNAALFEKNSAGLRQAFDSEKRSYSINRIEGLIKGEKPVFQRKEKTSDKGKEESQ